ncbi:uncharacterized protein PHACADRAFT_187397 [Phanerochaete carnosa HHB-10118-sp]|uniref:Telomere-associated protein Rif1 N-terminal domain-containing protein n=1 Tax=Phanerochaete carnosa (strain HHB-10118-sp) TaxID=650164 RepID=K5VZI8_PHACS|nr:uncharacterized protein PHACADRAFT_187397 [Phanerochaete carnosa HHB-10118-sp]EKM52034.1 hypothetical protein PHACADRAFT_187397 [Phanerochaete carnosa HHB-10118-sp]
MTRHEHEGKDASRPTTSTDSANYFQAPIDALVRSMKGKSSVAHPGGDLTRIYAAFASRIKTFATSAGATTASTSPAIEYLRIKGGAVLACISRDIRLAFAEPTLVKRPHSPTHPQSVSLHASQSQDGSIAEAAHSSAICHHAMRLASCILAFPALYTTLLSQGLDEVFDLLLDILNPRTLKTFNSQKTRGLAIWILSTQQLPATVLRTRDKRVIEVIEGILSDAESSEQMKGDGLKVLHNVLCRHPSLFFLGSIHLFPLVLLHIVSSSSSTRLRAAYALAGFTQAALWSRSDAAPAKHTKPSASAREYLHQQVSKFSETQCEWSREQAMTLRDFVAAALPAQDRSYYAKDISWAFSVMGCLAVLADGSFFSTPSLLKMIVRAMESVRNHDFTPLLYLHSFVWRCLVWAYGRLVDATELHAPQDPARVKEDSFREKVVAIVSQDGKFGVRSALVSVFLNEATRQPEGDAVTKAVLVVEELLQRSNSQLVKEGIALLRQLTNAATDPSRAQLVPPYDLQQVLVTELLDGTMVDIEPGRLASIVSRIGGFEPASARPLTDVELDTHWDRILVAWRRAMERVLKGGMKPGHDLLATWKSLLLVRSRAPQTSKNCAAAQDSVISTITRLATQAVPSEGFAPVLCTAVHELWKVVQSVCEQGWLIRVSNGLFEALLGIVGGILGLNDETEAALVALSTDLLVHGSPDLWRKLSSRLDNSNLCLRLWQLAAAKWTHIDPIKPWEDSVTFLSFPVNLSSASEETLAEWKKMFKFVISSAKASGISPDAVVENLMKETSHDLIPPAFIPIFITHLTLSDDNIVATTTLRHVNSFLSIYPSQDIYPSLDVIRALSSIISNCTSSNVVSALKILSEGLCVWIGADCNAVPSADYEKVLVGFYCTMLRRLREVTIPVNEVLRDLEDLLCLPLINIRSTTNALALKEFCEAVWRQNSSCPVTFPAKLLLHLSAFYDVAVPRAFHPDFLPEPSQSESQRQPLSQVNDLLQDPMTSIVRNRVEEVDGPCVRELFPSNASAGPEKVPDEQRKSSNDKHSHVLSDSSRINEGVDTCHGALERCSTRQVSLVFDHAALRSHRSPENMSPNESSPVSKKRPRPSEEEGWNQKKRQRIVDPATSKYLLGDTATRGDSSSTGHSYSGTKKSEDAELQTGSGLVCYSMSPEVPYPEQTALPSPPCTAEAAELEYQSVSQGGVTESSLGSSPPCLSQPLHTLQQAYYAIVANTDMSVGDTLAAQQIAAAMQTVLAARLKQKLARKDI